MRILMLATDAHGGYGGIAQYNRDVLDALSRSDRVEEVVVMLRAVAHKSFSSPAKVRYDTKSATGLWGFLRRSIAHALGGGRFDIIYCAHINLLPIAAVIAWVRRVPLVLTIYGIDAWARPRRWIPQVIARLPDLLISISQITLDRFRAWSGSRAEAVVVPNAIELSLFGCGERNKMLAERYNITGRTTLMTLGRMASDERYKGFDEVIEMLPNLRERYPDLIYLAAGDGADRQRLEAKALHMGVADMVRFVGQVPEADKADFYRLADAYVMPSSGEGFGFVVLEALACGIPVVASSTDGTFEAVRGGELGLVVDPRDPDALEGAIVEALQRPKCIHEGLEYFAFHNFERRMLAAMSRVVSV